MSVKEDWKAIGVHHKTAEKLANEKLTPEKVKGMTVEALVSEYKFTEAGAKGILELLNTPVKEETEAEPKAEKKPKETQAKEVSEEKPKKSKKKDEEGWVDPRSLPLKERMKLAQKICKDSGLMVNIASEMEELDYGRKSTGITALNALLDGGWPKGKFSLIAGRYQSCKSLLCIKTIAADHAADPNAIWIWADAENAFDKDWAVKQGVDLTRLIIVRPMIADDMFTEVERLIREVGVTGVVVDSIGALLSWQEVMKDRDDKTYTKTIDKDTMALTARFLSKFYRRFTPLVAQHTTTFIFITHLYSTMDQYKPDAAKGGNAMLYGSHVMVWTDRRKGDQDKKQRVKMPDGRVEEMYTAYEVTFRVEKTRQSATEGQKVAVPFVYGKGLSEQHSVIEMAMGMGIIRLEGTWYTHPSFIPALEALGKGADNGWVNGRQNAIEFVKNNPPVFEKILEEVGTAMTADIAIDDEENDDERDSTD